MKVFAIGTIIRALSDEEREQVMRKEVPHTLQLYLDGKIEQFWFRHDKLGVVFLMNAETIEQAKAVTDAMPLVAGGYAAYEFMQVGPLVPLGRLIQGV
jgi:hypothetical protein